MEEFFTALRDLRMVHLAFMEGIHLGNVDRTVDYLTHVYSYVARTPNSEHHEFLRNALLNMFEACDQVKPLEVSPFTDMVRGSWQAGDILSILWDWDVLGTDHVFQVEIAASAKPVSTTNTFYGRQHVETTPPRDHDYVAVFRYPNSFFYLFFKERALHLGLDAKKVLRKHIHKVLMRGFRDADTDQIRLAARQITNPQGCDVCGLSAEKTCGECRTGLYCGVEHQTQDFRRHKHTFSHQKCRFPVGGTVEVRANQQRGIVLGYTNERVCVRFADAASETVSGFPIAQLCSV
jgi:hypothetical protein